MAYKMFSEEKLSQEVQKKQESIGIKSFYLNASYGLEYENCITKLSIKMFIKKHYRLMQYRMLLSFKMSITYKKTFNFTPDNCVRCEAAFIGHNSIFRLTLFDVGANIQA